MTEAGVEVLLQRLDPELDPPAYAHPGDAGADLRSRETFVLQPGERRLVSTGIADRGAGRLCGFRPSRAPGLAANHGVSIVNAPGTIDAGYRGEVRVCLINTDQQAAIQISRGDRIAQLVVQPVSQRANSSRDRIARLQPGCGRVRIDRSGDE